MSVIRFVGASAVALAMWTSAPAPSSAQAVYCTRPGFPVGCVARPVVVRPVAPGAAVRAATPGVGAPGVGVAPGVGAPGVGVAPGVGAPGAGANTGGPVNRVGVR